MTASKKQPLPLKNNLYWNQIIWTFSYKRELLIHLQLQMLLEANFMSCKIYCEQPGQVNQVPVGDDLLRNKKNRKVRLLRTYFELGTTLSILHILITVFLSLFNSLFFFLFYFVFTLTYMCIQCLCHIPPRFQGAEPVPPTSSTILLKRRHKR